MDTLKTETRMAELQVRQEKDNKRIAGLEYRRARAVVQRRTILSPVDGVVTEIEQTDRCVVQGEAYRIRIRIDSLGTYTARSPVEGKVMDLHSNVEGVGEDCPANALWVRTDEGDSVVLMFDGYRFGLAPRAFTRFGERVGQGHRCAYLRLARFADVYMPIAGKVKAKVGERVIAGTDLLGTVPHP